MNPLAIDAAMAADRRAAGAVQQRKEAALGTERDIGIGIGDGFDERVGAIVVAPRFDSDGTLADRRQKLVDAENARRLVGEAEAFQAGERQQRGIGFAVGELAQARLDIAAHHLDLEVGPQPQHHGLAPQRGGADHRTRRQIGKRGRLLADEDIARVLARQERRQPGGVRQEGRHVLGGMHREVDVAREQSFLDLLGEQALATGFRQGAVLDRVARGADHANGDPLRIDAMGARQPGAHVMGLCQRQGAAARADGRQNVAPGSGSFVGRLHPVASQCYANEEGQTNAGLTANARACIG